MHVSPRHATATSFVSCILLSALSGCAGVGFPSNQAGVTQPSGLIHVLEGHSSWVSSVSWSPDGKLLASGSGDATIRIWDVAKESTVQTLRLERGAVTSVAWSPDGKHLASGHAEPSGRLRVWDTTTWQVVQVMNPTGFVRVVAWSPNGSMLAVGQEFADPNKRADASQSGITVYDAATGKELARIPRPDDIGSLSWSPDSTQIAARFIDPTPAPNNPMSFGTGHVLIWDVSKERSEASTNNSKTNYTVKEPVDLSGFSSVDWSPDGKFLALGVGNEQSEQLAILDTATWNRKLTLTTRANGVNHVRWSPDGMRLAIGGTPSVEIWDVAQQKQLYTFPLFDAVNEIAWSPDSSLLATGSEDGYVRIWEVK